MQKIATFREKEQRYINSKILYLSLLAGVGLGILNAWFDTFVFFAGTGTFLDFLLFNVPANEAFSRTFILALFILFGYFFSKKHHRFEYARALLENSLNKSPEVIYWLDKKGKFYYVNCRAAESLGYLTEEFKGLNVFDLHRNDNMLTKEKWKQRWRELQEKKVLQYETQQTRKDGKVIDVEIIAKLIVHHKREFFVAYVRDIGERKDKERRIIQLNKELEIMASTDMLTGIFNRYKFDDFLRQYLAEYKRYNKSIVLIMWDIDHFKKVNDAYGHMAGDSVLKQLTSLVKACIRESDIFARWGGEEFVVLLPHTTLQEAQSVANKIHIGIEKHHFKTVGKVTVSIGVTAAKKDDTVESFLLRADKALYLAKNSGRNRVVYSEEEKNATSS